MLEFRILGPLEVLDDGRQVALGGPKQRALLALLILGRREPVSADRLIDDLWGERPPATASKTLQVYISHLRKALGADAVVTRGGGYMLSAEPEAVDLDRFRRLASEGRDRMEAGDAQAAADSLGRALELWRGPPLAELAFESFAPVELARLDDERLAAQEDRFDAELALGNHAAVAGEIEQLARANPLRERVAGQLMLALYRSGRQADALARYRDLREALISDHGLEPDRSLRDLEQRIIDQDPALDAPRPAPRLAAGRPSRARTGALLIAGGGLALLGVAIAAALSSGGIDEVSPNTVAVIGADSGDLQAQIPVGAGPSEIAAGKGSLWVANTDDSTISQIDPATMEVVGTTGLGTSVDGIAAGSGGVWVSDISRHLLVRVDPEFRQVVERIPIGADFERQRYALGPVAVGEGAVWVANGQSTVLRVDPGDNEVRSRIDVGNDPTAIAVGESSVWVADDVDDTVTRIDPAGDGAVAATIPVGQAPSALAVGDGSVWVANTQDDTVARIDADSGAVEATIAVGRGPAGVTVGEQGVWVANNLDGTVSRIDPDSNAVEETLELGEGPKAVVETEESIWVATQRGVEPPALSAGSGGDGLGTLRVLQTEDTGDADPALFAGDYQRASETCALLQTYPDLASPAGEQLEPEVAAEPPEISEDGLTYTFTLRDDYVFSPPSNEPVAAAAFERAFERALDPRMQSFAAPFLLDIQGAKDFQAGKADSISGVDASGKRLEITLERPVYDFPARLAMPSLCAVPPKTPIAPKGVGEVPSAGPYYVADYTPNRSIVLRRNPNYAGDRPAEPDEIHYELGVPPEEAIERVEAGEADYYSNNTVLGSELSPDVQERLEARYGQGSPAAEQDRQQYFVEPRPTMFYLLFNSTRPPFDDPRMRQAVNFALDRRALATEPFPGSTGRPTDQYVPPGLPGFRDAAVYPLGGPNLSRAKQLARPWERPIVLFTCNLPPCAHFAQIVSANLGAVGLEVDVRRLAIPTLFERTQTPGERFDLAQWAYLLDFPDPYDFINQQFAPESPLGHLLDDPDADAAMNEVAGLAGEERLQAYADLDEGLAREVAPAAAYASGTSVNLFSERVGCQLNQPIHGIVLGGLCLRDGG